MQPLTEAPPQPAVAPRAVVDIRTAPGPWGCPGWRYVAQATCCSRVWLGWTWTRAGAQSRGLREYVRHRTTDHGCPPRIDARRWVLRRLARLADAPPGGGRYG